MVDRLTCGFFTYSGYELNNSSSTWQFVLLTSHITSSIVWGPIGSLFDLFFHSEFYLKVRPSQTSSSIVWCPIASILYPILGTHRLLILSSLSSRRGWITLRSSSYTPFAFGTCSYASFGILSARLIHSSILFLLSWVSLSSQLRGRIIRSSSCALSSFGTCVFHPDEGFSIFLSLHFHSGTVLMSLVMSSVSSLRGWLFLFLVSKRLNFVRNLFFRHFHRNCARLVSSNFFSSTYPYRLFFFSSFFLMVGRGRFSHDILFFPTYGLPTSSSSNGHRLASSAPLLQSCLLAHLGVFLSIFYLCNSIRSITSFSWAPAPIFWVGFCSPRSSLLAPSSSGTWSALIGFAYTILFFSSAVIHLRLLRHWIFL